MKVRATISDRGSIPRISTCLPGVWNIAGFIFAGWSRLLLIAVRQAGGDELVSTGLDGRTGSIGQATALKAQTINAKNNVLAMRGKRPVRSNAGGVFAYAA